MTEYEIYGIAILGALIAGGINTLAGNGSVITLTILTEVLGLPPNIANGTNRIGVFTQCAATSWVFYKNGKLKIADNKKYIIPVFIGALAGGILAVTVSNEQFRAVFKFMMVFMLIAALVKPKRWLQKTDLNFKPKWYFYTPLLFALGFYGGFIQMGMGVFFLIIMVLGMRHNIIESNALKSFVIGVYTLLLIFVFHYQGLMDWKIGGIMAVGQTIGGYLTARFASKHKKADVIAYYLLIIVLVLALIKLFFS
ncbi:sulfite exporter TauE/SafE family protein [Oceanihabitans sp. IOP_32]|uniref:sulfite exporter TauE/SafE family protein n=1 Tax=Oceanihabitans sp. IOP_32 TaxID=2529032 RepID=UPI001293B1E5|nr:sulfite exporter TauE/SafE family protein [Oceanihabitans sp. IOP_32]QFZ53906.1 sulfite exporter TauE/SafE family protein [Oceanihabitans sp. IOP_32]